MTTQYKQASLILIAVLGLLCTVTAYATQATQKEVFTLTYLMFDNDEHYEPRRSYTGLKLEEPKRPLQGVQLGLKESKVIGRSLGIKFNLIELSVNSTSDYLATLQESLATTGSFVVIADLPKDALIDLSSKFKHLDVLLFNARLKDDDLRAQHCAQKLFHTIPSHTMLTDALAQFLKSKNWTSVLSLRGPLAEDERLSLAMDKSAHKFGLKIVATKEFVLSNNPRDRDKTNVATMTGRPKHDTVFIADHYGEFARYVPYQTYSSKLVVGAEGLIPAAWHWTWERHGAPQLNQRFDKLADARLSSEQWAGWAVVKSLVSALVKQQPNDFKELYSRLSSDLLTVDLYKGAPGSFRPWNNQLRQPLLLHTHSAVIERAPLDGFMHHRNTLDTLGTDEAESSCRW